VAPQTPLAPGYGISPFTDILGAMARGKRPKRMVFLLGYAGWGPGQLEGEMRRGAWETAPADEDILFDADHPTKWERAMERRTRTL
jgi:putative transcriptional regulator